MHVRDTRGDPQSEPTSYMIPDARSLGSATVVFASSLPLRAFSANFAAAVVSSVAVAVVDSAVIAVGVSVAAASVVGATAPVAWELVRAVGASGPDAPSLAAASAAPAEPFRSEDATAPAVLFPAAFVPVPALDDCALAVGAAAPAASIRQSASFVVPGPALFARPCFLHLVASIASVVAPAGNSGGPAPVGFPVVFFGLPVRCQAVAVAFGSPLAADAAIACLAHALPAVGVSTAIGGRSLLSADEGGEHPFLAPASGVPAPAASEDQAVCDVQPPTGAGVPVVFAAATPVAAIPFDVFSAHRDSAEGSPASPCPFPPQPVAPDVVAAAGGVAWPPLPQRPRRPFPEVRTTLSAYQ